MGEQAADAGAADSGAAGTARAGAPTAGGATPPFEQGLAELERIVRELESGELGLEEALRLYERGVALVRGCGAQLEAAEARLQVLTLDAGGQPLLRPLEEPSA